MALRAYIETYGCQMNEADTELLFGLLGAQGVTRAARAEDADVVLLNTCAVREKAEERIFGRLGWLKPIKAARPELVVGVVGCMAEHLRARIAERAPHVDLIAGPDAYGRLADLIARARDERDPLVDVRLDRHELYAGAPIDRAPGVSGYVTVMRGCDKFCSFCIVPYVRGRERSAAPAEILRQVREMAAAGFREVVLLGQTVSSYRVDDCDFGELLRRVHAVEGIARIRFTAPYPTDFTDALLATIAELPRVERHLHLPLQSGSSRVLAAMRRGYTAEAYRALCRKIRSELPELSITTDLIVGYPGESEEDFAATLETVAEVRFDHAYMFKYSERSGTIAARTAVDDVPPAVKQRRLEQLIALQEDCCRRSNEAMIGRLVEVLVAGRNPRPALGASGLAPADGGEAAQVIGRTSCFKTTVLPGDHPPGQLVRARITGASAHTLFGEPTDDG